MANDNYLSVLRKHNDDFDRKRHTYVAAFLALSDHRTEEQKNLIKDFDANHAGSAIAQLRREHVPNFSRATAIYKEIFVLEEKIIMCTAGAFGAAVVVSAMRGMLINDLGV